MSIKDDLTEILKTRNAGAFLFVGSGFSRRYLNLEDWKGLLSRFCIFGKPFEYYLASADGDMPRAAGLLANEFNEYWWSAEEYKQSVERYKHKIKNSTSALRLEISNYLQGLKVSAVNEDLQEEVQLLANLNVDGIITTNWDLFLEDLFPDYKRYVGQNELLFSNSQEIGEIYKIHGCASQPESMILTQDDYAAFQDRNPYLAAKLITIFVEHPVIFLGYSISDPNISSLLRAISLCLGKDQVEQLRKNLIFVQRPREGEQEGISDTFLTIDGVQIPLVLVRVSSFAEIYHALSETKRKIPARVLRYCKEQLYELVRSSEPEKKLCVIDIDSIDQNGDIEFLVGVGVSSHQASDLSDFGYEAIEIKDLISDLLHNNKAYEPNKIIESVIRRAGRNTPYIPIYKYLAATGIEKQADLKELESTHSKWLNRQQKDYQAKNYKASFFKRRHMTMQQLIDDCTPEAAAAMIPFLDRKKIDLELLRNFLIANEHKIDPTISNYSSYFRKLAAFYDQLKYGW